MTNPIAIFIGMWYDESDPLHKQVYRARKAAGFQHSSISAGATQRGLETALSIVTAADEVVPSSDIGPFHPDTRHLNEKGQWVPATSYPVYIPQ